ncbi:MAG: hypothetical protein R6V10_15795 [bacterium]
MKFSRIFFVIIGAALLVACTSGNDKGITGKWVNEKEELKIEFRKDGTFTNTEKGRTFEGEYKRVDKSTLLVEVGEKQMKFNIELVGKTLKMKDPEGHQGTVELKRAD